MDRFSAIIIGGGPAGCATAIGLARRGHAVLLLEQSQYEDWRVGETLPPHIQPQLSQLGVWERFLGQGHLPSYAIHSSWGSTRFRENDFIFSPYGTGWHVDRKRFDAMLAQCAEEAGARVVRRVRVAALSREGGEWQVVVEEEAAWKARAPFFVDATGRAGRLARLQGSRRLLYDRMIGLIGMFAPQAPQAAVPSLLLLEAAEDGWWYSAPMPEGCLLVCYMTDVDLLTRSGLRRNVYWGIKLGRTMHTVARTQGFRFTGEIRVRPAFTSRLDPPAGPGWLAVGDAASVYDPLSAEGVNKAFKMGLSAAAAIHSQALEGYAASIGQGFARYLEQRAKFYRKETRWPQSPFWQRRQSVQKEAYAH